MINKMLLKNKKTLLILNKKKQIIFNVNNILNLLLDIAKMIRNYYVRSV